MRYEKIIKRADGSKIKIEVLFYMDFRTPHYSVTIWNCLPRKRTYNIVSDKSNYQYRRLDAAQRKEYIQTSNLQFVTPEEIYQAKIELWETLKPAYE